MTKILLGDCLEELKSLDDNSIDSIVTDPPYGLSFMGKAWDYDVPTVAIWKECLRVLKPGGHLLAFGGTRTYHRLVVAIEDAGFEIRDQIQWLYGQGFPKSMDISKAIDKEAGAERDRYERAAFGGTFSDDAGTTYGTVLSNEPITLEARRWSGWGTALKPANEPICLARKPLSEKTVAKNVLKHGVGGLNIDGTRIEGEARPLMIRTETVVEATAMAGKSTGATSSGEMTNLGRFPSNVILDESAAEVLDGQSGQMRARGNKTAKDHGGEYNATSYKMGGLESGNPGDAGGASRFFYVAKASKFDRGEGNIHPTVKPIKLMEYLVKLVTPEGGTVLDPFMGSGTTGVAALNLSFKFVGIERDEKYFEISEGRIRDTLAARKLARMSLNNKAVV